MPTTTRRTPAEPRAAYHHGDLKRAVVDAALALVAEEQNWDFSLREVARRAGVSHNAPYNHFEDKRDLLAAVAVAGFETLRARIAAAVANADAPDAAVVAIGVAYVRFGTDNPAHYRLMFGTALKGPGGELPPAVQAAAKAARTVLAGAVTHCAEAGLLAAPATDAAAINLAVLSAWTLVHGLTLLLVDGLVGDPGPAIAEAVSHTLMDGLRRR